MSGRYIKPFVSGNFLPLSGGTVTGDTVFSEGLTGATISISSGFTFNVDAVKGRVLVSSDDLGNSKWEDISEIISGGTRIQQGSNILTGGTSLSPSISLVDSPSVKDFSSSGFSYNNEVYSSGLTAVTLNVSKSLEPLVDNFVNIGNPVKRFRSLNTVNGVAVKFTASTINLDDLEVTKNNIVLTGDTIDSGTY